MNSTLSHHFRSFEDKKYLQLIEKLQNNLSKVKALNVPLEILKVCEESLCIADYLITFARNVIRLGCRDEYPDIDFQLDSLYDIEEQFDEYATNSALKICDDIGTENLPSELKEYFIYFKSAKIEEVIQNITTNKESEVFTAVEHYQYLLNFAEGENNISLAEMYKKALKETNKARLVELEYAIEKICQKEQTKFQDFIVKIKNYQSNVAKSCGYGTALNYMEDKHNVEHGSLIAMEKCLNDYILKYKISNNICIPFCKKKIYCKENVTFESAMEIMYDCFNKLSVNFGDMIKIALRNNWIDWQERKGKLQGAYTNNIFYTGESIICLTFDGSIADMCKLAHELGHAYHCYKMTGQSYFKTDFSIVTAEAFALFCEEYLLIYLKEKYEYLEKELQNEWNNSIKNTLITNYISYKFEQELFNNLDKQNLNVTKMYEDIIKNIYGNEIDSIKKYEWIFRTQNFFCDYYYYNFVYIIGMVIALNLIVNLKTNKLNFEQIEDMLKRSGKESVESLFDKLDIDIQNLNSYRCICDLYEIFNKS